jgi:hypothetical protein
MVKVTYKHKDPHKELTRNQKGQLAEDYFEQIYKEKGCRVQKTTILTNGKFKVRRQVKSIIKKSKYSSEKKRQLLQFLLEIRLGLPDFIVLTKQRKTIFVEVKYFNSTIKNNQYLAHKRIRDLGYEVLIKRMPKPQPATQMRLAGENKRAKNNLFKKIVNIVIYWRKPYRIIASK